MRVIMGLLWCLCLLPAMGWAQVDSLQGAWKHSAVFRVAGTQAGFQNWQKGGVSSLALTSSFEGTFQKTTSRWNSTHQIHLVLGTIQQDTLAFRKSDDQIRYQGSFDVKWLNSLRPTISVGVETQFLPGFNYKKNPFGDERVPPVKVSDILSPAYVTQGLGLTYAPWMWVRLRFGFGAKETVVLIERLRPLYGVRITRPVRVEAGLESRMEFDREVARNVRWKSSAAFFAAFNKPELPDAVWRNEILMRVNSWLTTRLETEMLYDRDISRKIQFREVLALSVVFRLL